MEATNHSQIGFKDHFTTLNQYLTQLLGLELVGRQIIGLGKNILL